MTGDRRDNPRSGSLAIREEEIIGQMSAIAETLSIAGLGIVIVFSVLALLLAATRVMSRLLRTPDSGKALASTAAPADATIDQRHLACIVAAVNAAWGEIPAHLTVKRLD